MEFIFGMVVGAGLFCLGTVCGAFAVNRAWLICLERKEKGENQC